MIAAFVLALIAAFQIYDIWDKWKWEIEGFEYDCPDWKLEPK